MDYVLKSNHDFSPTMEGQYQKPRICPYCGNGNDATIGDHSVIKMTHSASALVGAFKCTLCDKVFLHACYRETATGNTDAVAAFTYPRNKPVYDNPVIANFSPRFISVYKQALRSEFYNDIELAAIGYRAALEILVKDYAVNELSVSPEEAAKKTLFDSISDYLGSKDLISAADVVRILGNDYAHYERKHSDLDFNVLKKYMDLLINLVEAKYLLKHPPVARND